MSALLTDSTDMKPFEAWRASLSVAEEKEQRFDEWIFLNASSVLLSEKTGELLSLSLGELGLSEAEVEAGLDRLSGMWGFSYRLLYSSRGLLKMILFQEDRLQAVLDGAPFCIMGAKLNYSYPLRTNSFVDEIKERWHQHGALPHEIGVALGYPLDDVFGYMGLLPLPCKGVCGWQVYGCMQESRRRSCAFSNARCRALMFLAQASRA
jgi:hypothetical protein